MDVSDVKHLKALEHENSELKPMVAEKALDIRMLQDVNSKKSEPSRPSTSRRVSAIGLRGQRASSPPDDGPASLHGAVATKFRNQRVLG